MQIEQERFEAWLMAQPDHRGIYANSANGCFLCSFLTETSKIKPTFGNTVWAPKPIILWPFHDVDGQIVGHEECALIPAWARKLINLSDLKQVCTDKSRFGQHRIPITCGQMKARYRQLYPENPIDAAQTPVPELADAKT